MSPFHYHCVAWLQSHGGCHGDYQLVSGTVVAGVQALSHGQAESPRSPKVAAQMLSLQSRMLLAQSQSLIAKYRLGGLRHPPLQLLLLLLLLLAWRGPALGLPACGHAGHPSAERQATGGSSWPIDASQHVVVAATNMHYTHTHK